MDLATLNALAEQLAPLVLQKIKGKGKKEVSELTTVNDYENVKSLPAWYWNKQTGEKKAVNISMAEFQQHVQEEAKQNLTDIKQEAEEVNAAAQESAASAAASAESAKASEDAALAQKNETVDYLNTVKANEDERISAENARKEAEADRVEKEAARAQAIEAVVVKNEEQDQKLSELDMEMVTLIGAPEEKIDLSGIDAISGIIDRDDLTFRNDLNYGLHKYKIIEVLANRTLVVTPLNTAYSTRILPLKSKNLVSGSIADACDGYSSIIPQIRQFEFVLPSDCKYLYVYTQNRDGDNFEPISILYKAEDGRVNKKVDKVEGKGLSSNDFTDKDKANLADIAEKMPKDEGSYVMLSVPFNMEVNRYISRNTGNYNISSIITTKATDIYEITNRDDELYVDCTCSKGSVGVAYYDSQTPSSYSKFKEYFQCWAESDTVTFEKVKLEIPEGATHWAFSTKDYNTFALYKKTESGFVKVASVEDLKSYLQKNQGAENFGKFMQVGEDGNIYPNEVVIPAPQEEYVKKQQGVGNAGKVLQVGVDGNVTLGSGSGQVEDITSCIRRQVTKTIYLGENLISGVIGSGNGWTHNEGLYFHASGSDDYLEFGYDTNAGDIYVAILNYSKIGQEEGAVCVSIGEGALCDIYNGTLGKFYIGMISDGGRLKILAKSTYDGIVSGVELRKVVSQEDAETSVTLDTESNKHFENVDGGTMANNITAWWNVAIGSTDTLASNQNGSRNVGIGQRALTALESGTRNIGVGTFALFRLREGSRNIAIGADAAWEITKGEDNVAVGKAAFGEIRGKSVGNVAIGTSALSLITEYGATNNVAVGMSALAGGDETKEKHDCVAVGYNAGRRNGQDCVAIGSSSSFYIQGSGNIAIGKDAMNLYGVDGINNVCIGISAKLYPDSRPATINNAIVIGANSKAKASNEIVIGNSQNNLDYMIIGNKKIIFNTDGSVTWTTL